MGTSSENLTNAILTGANTGNTQYANPVQTPILERLSSQIDDTLSNIEKNMGAIAQKINRIHPKAQQKECKLAESDNEPDDGSMSFRIRLSMRRLNNLELESVHLLEHLDKIVG